MFYKFTQIITIELSALTNIVIVSSNKTAGSDECCVAELLMNILIILIVRVIVSNCSPAPFRVVSQRFRRIFFLLSSRISYIFLLDFYLQFSQVNKTITKVLSAS